MYIQDVPDIGDPFHPDAIIEFETPKHPVSAEEYLRLYAERHCEYVNGNLIRLSPSDLVHNRLTSYLYLLFEVYLEAMRAGEVMRSSFLLQLSESPSCYRIPDVFVILNRNKDRLLDDRALTADICIEVVGRNSVQRDMADKFLDYERFGIAEYWIFDPKRRNTFFFRLNDLGVYQQHFTGETYTSPLLPRFQLHLPNLWQSRSHPPSQIIRTVDAMLNASATTDSPSET